MKIFFKWSAIIVLVISQSIFWSAPTKTQASTSNVILVNYAADPGGDGETWDTAFNDLQVAIDAAGVGDTIWVAKGIYYPQTQQTIAFEINKDIAIYGGFEAGATQLSDRNIKVNETILSGDTKQDDDSQQIDFNKTDNAKTVLQIKENVTNAMILDGFTISGGYGGTQHSINFLTKPIAGGGIFVLNGEPTLNELTIKHNYAPNGGGLAVINTDTNNIKKLLLTNSEFTNNKAKQGGAIYNYINESTFENVTITKNVATEHGAGIYAQMSPELTINNTLIQENEAAKSGGGIYLNLMIKTNINDSTITHNKASVDGGGMYVGANVNINHTKINHNEAKGNGGGMYSSSGTIALKAVEIIGNRATKDGGGVYYNFANATIKNSKVNENYAGVNAGGFYSRGIQHLYNSEMINNEAAGKGSTVFQYTTKFHVYNSTFVQHDGDTQAFTQDGSVFLYVYNSIFKQSVSSKSNDEVHYYSTLLSSDEEEAEFYDETGVTDNEKYRFDEIFIDQAAQDFRLKKGAKAINTGSQSFIDDLQLDTTLWNAADFEQDLTGKPRKIGGLLDLGAYEYTSVIYDANGAQSGTVPENFTTDDTITVMSNSGNLDRPSEDVRFAGWNTKADGTGTLYRVGDNFIVTTGNETLFVQWAYPIVIEENNGNASKTIYAPQGETIAVTQPSRSGYVWKGWYTDTQLTNTWDINTNVISSAMTLYGKWAKLADAPTNVVANAGNAQATVKFTESLSGDHPVDSYTVKVFLDGVEQPSLQVTKTASPITITGLKNGEKYTFKVFATTADGDGEDSIASNEVVPYKSSTPSPSPSPSPSVPSISSEIVNENGTNVVIWKVEGVTNNQNGVITNEIDMTVQQLQQIIALLREHQTDMLRIELRDNYEPIDQSNVRISLNIIGLLAQEKVQLTIQSFGARLSIPVEGLKAVSEDLYFEFSLSSETGELLGKAKQNDSFIARDTNMGQLQLIGSPIQIHTNYKNLPASLMLTGEVREFDLNDIFIFIDHSDGSQQVIKPIIEGNVLLFDINHFSTFAILSAPKNVEEQPQVPEPTPETVTQAPYIKGYDDGTFKPNNNVTRAQMASMLARFLTNDSIPEAQLTFSDISKHNARDAIEFVKERGLFNGNTATTFNPNGYITRVQMAVVADRWITMVCAENPTKSFCNSNSMAKTFKDVPTNYWAAKEIARISALNIMTGKNTTTFDPGGYLTRAQAVKVLNRLFERQALNVENSFFNDVSSKHWAIGEIEAAAREIKR